MTPQTAKVKRNGRVVTNPSSIPLKTPAISSSIRLIRPSFWTFQPVFGHSVHASRVGEPGETPDSPEGCTPDSSGSAGTALEATQPNRFE